MSTIRYYVCDACGALTTRRLVPEGGDWTCGKCGNQAAWEFADRRAARDHAAHVQKVAQSGLFRRTGA